MAQKIFAFGGHNNGSDHMKSAEVFDVVTNSWKQLPDMPQAGLLITCVSVKNQILFYSQ